MLKEKTAVFPNVLQLSPAAAFYRLGVQVIYLCALHGKKKGRMGRNDELTIIKAQAVGEKFGQATHKRGRQAVFRLIEKIQTVPVYKTGEMAKCGLAVGFSGDIPHDAGGDILGAVFPGNIGGKTQTVKILQTMQAVRISVPGLKVALRGGIFGQKLALAAGYALVYAAQIKKLIKNIIAAYYAAAIFDLIIHVPAFPGAAKGKIIGKKAAFVEWSAADKAKLFRNKIQQGAFSASVAAAENVQLGELKAGHGAPRKNSEGVTAAIKAPAVFDVSHRCVSLGTVRWQIKTL